MTCKHYGDQDIVSALPRREDPRIKQMWISLAIALILDYRLVMISLSCWLDEVWIPTKYFPWDLEIVDNTRRVLYFIKESRKTCTKCYSTSYKCSWLAALGPSLQKEWGFSWCCG